MAEKKKIMVLRIHMGGGEYDSNCPMQKLAEDAFKSMREQIDKTGIPLLVYVYEHGGWALAFAEIKGELKIVSSANDAAKYSPDVQEFRDMAYNAETVEMGTIRRKDINATAC